MRTLIFLLLFPTLITSQTPTEIEMENEWLKLFKSMEIDLYVGTKDFKRHEEEGWTAFPCNISIGEEGHAFVGRMDNGINFYENIISNENKRAWEEILEKNDFGDGYTVLIMGGGGMYILQKDKKDIGYIGFLDNSDDWKIYANLKLDDDILIDLFYTLPNDLSINELEVKGEKLSEVQDTITYEYKYGLDYVYTEKVIEYPNVETIEFGFQYYPRESLMYQLINLGVLTGINDTKKLKNFNDNYHSFIYSMNGYELEIGVRDDTPSENNCVLFATKYKAFNQDPQEKD